MASRLISLLLLFGLAVGAGFAEESGSALPKQHAKAVSQHVTRLAALAEWCRKAGVYAARHDVYMALLTYDPDHAKARRQLKFKLEDGAWVQRKGYKPPKNFSSKKLPAYEERRRALEAAFADDLDLVFAACKTPADLGWAQGIAQRWQSARPEDARPKQALRSLAIRRYQFFWGAGRAKEMEAVAEVLRSTYPLDERIRSLLGEVQLDGAWILTETDAGLASRERLRAALPELLAEHLEPPAKELNTQDLMLGLTGVHAFQSGHIRAVGTISEADLRTFGAHMEAAGPFFQAALGKAPSRRPLLNVYLLAKEDELDAFLARFPKLDPALAKQKEQHGLHLFWANNTTLCAGPIMPRAQRELALGVLFMVFLADTWFGHDNMPGWLDEGVSRHLSFLMTGTRFGISVGGRYGGKDPTVTRNVPDAHGNWLKAAHKRIGKLPPWDLRLLMGKGIDAFTAADSILAYVLAVYLIEGVPKRGPAFLERLGEGEDPDLAARKALGMPLTVLSTRLRRFLAERAAQD